MNKRQKQNVIKNKKEEADCYINLKVIADKWTKHMNIEITVEALVELLVDKKWIKDGEITKRGKCNNKIICEEGEYCLSPRGYELLLTHYNKLNDKKLIEWAREKHLEETLPF